jgi:uncharacterized membrane protein YeaQ/YmgE (transglycosylase-associated protein family)
MGWFLYILIGAAVGIIARLIHPGKENMGWIMTVILGILGAVVAALIGQTTGWYGVPSWLGFGVSIVIAVILVTIYAAVKGKKK